MAESVQRVPKRILTNLISSVSAGVVPRTGAPYLAIGRKDEIAALLSDLESINDGNGTLRFLIGPYGSGKSFLIQLIRGYALERNFITADADLSPERRLHGAAGSGVATYRELIKNMASRINPDGGALAGLLTRWMDGFREELLGESVDETSPVFATKLQLKVQNAIRELENQVGGFDFAKVVTTFFQAYLSGNDELRSACLRWLRGEYANRSEARHALGYPVSIIIGDDNWYDFMKLWASLVRLMGYRGLMMFIDECVNLYKIPHKISRENNYEKILSMFNDTLQGRAPGLGIVFGGTPQFLEDTRRGLFSYEALRSRLCDSRFNAGGFVNMIGPVIRLRRLSDDELYALLKRITALYEQLYSWQARMSEQEMMEFLQICMDKAGANLMITPREILRDYLTVLNLLYQNPNATFKDIAKDTIHLTPTFQSEELSEEVCAQPKAEFNADDIVF